jgi:hypothetical protein
MSGEPSSLSVLVKGSLRDGAWNEPHPAWPIRHTANTHAIVFDKDSSIALVPFILMGGAPAGWAGKFFEVVAGASVAQQMNIEYRARSDEG